MKNKIVSLVLAISICWSMMVFCMPSAGASLVPSSGNLPAVSYQYAPSVGDYDIYKQSMGSALSAVASPEVMMDMMEHVSQFEFNEYGEVSLEELQSIQYSYNDNFLRRLYRQIDFNPTTGFFTTAEITEIPSRGILRLVDNKTGQYIADWKGNYPFVRVANDVTPQNNTVFNNDNKWVRLDDLSNLPGVIILNENELARMCADLNTFYGMDCSLHTSGEFEFIKSGRQSFYANFAGKPYVAIREKAPTATDVVRPPVTEDNIIIENNNGLVIDRNEGTLNLPLLNGDYIGANIENMEFDFSSPSYNLNVSIPIDVGGVTVNYHYTYNITYNITNTYITYIGSNDAYEREEYELYYQLPDGRSSADLTAEEVAGMSFEFYDVVNYQRSTDDVSVRALYHFDGTTDDDSYFSGQGFFVWNDGASITYMESPSPFEGNLYLDNTAHSFDIVLPASIGSGDFQLQFRHYQASEIDTLDNKENKLTFGNAVLSWDESNLYFNGSQVASLPVGTWHEIAFTRYNGAFYVYLNGLLVGTGADTSYLSSVISFEFGSTSRAYTMLDELRVLNICQMEGAKYYSPTVVPYDSNLVLVLPDSELPIADSYFQTVFDPDAVYTADWSSFSFDDALPADFLTRNNFSVGCWSYNSGQLSSANGGLTIATGDYTYIHPTAGGTPTSQGFAFPMSGMLNDNTDYTVTVVLTDGSCLSHTFNSRTIRLGYSDSVSTVARNYCWDSSSSNDVFSIHAGSYLTHYVNVVQTRASANSLILLFPAVSGTTFDVMAVEIVEGTETELKVEEITSVYSGIDLQPNTAAIQTTIPVNGYTVGGVRPTMPNRGDCWFPVSGNRITSVQIYTGTHWEEVNARWYTGSRWIPIYAFDITTLEDLFDIADGDSVVPLLPDQNSFLRWWQLQWLDFRAWLEGALSNIGSGGGGTSLPDDETLPGEVDDPATDDDDGWSFVDLLVKTKDGIWRITKGIVRTAAGGITGLVVLINDAGDFFEPFQEGYTDGVGDLMNYGGDDIWD